MILTLKTIWRPNFPSKYMIAYTFSNLPCHAEVKAANNKFWLWSRKHTYVYWRVHLVAYIYKNLLTLYNIWNAHRCNLNTGKKWLFVSNSRSNLPCMSESILGKLISRTLLVCSSFMEFPWTAVSGWVFLRRLLWPARRRLQLRLPSSNSWRTWNLRKKQWWYSRCRYVSFLGN